MQGDPIPYGYCHCGCGQKTRLARYTDKRHGHVKGEPVRYLKAHHHRGKIVSEATRLKISAAISGEKGGHWRGANAGYRALHSRLSQLNPKTGRCEQCGHEGETQYALIHGHTYSAARDDYRELCVRCHVRYDVRVYRRFSDDDIRAIRAAIASGATQTAVASQFGVTNSAIARIVHRKHYADVE